MKSEMSGVRQGVGLVVTSLLSTPLMMLQMAALQLVSLDTQGMPSIRSLVAVLIIYIGVIGHSWGNRKMERRSGCFCFQATSYFIIMFQQVPEQLDRDGVPGVVLPLAGCQCPGQ